MGDRGIANMSIVPTAASTDLPRPALQQVCLTLGAVACLGVLWWRIVYHPLTSRDFFALFFSLQHIAIAAVLGACVTRLPLRTAKLLLSLAGAVVMTGLWGGGLLVCYLVQTLAVYAAVMLTRRGSAARQAFFVGLMLAAGLLACWWLRATVTAVIGVWVWLFFRCISFAVEARRGCPASLLDYVAYMFFYPTVLGTVEVYDEFQRANLMQPRLPQYVHAALRFALGFIRVTVAVKITYSFNDVVQVESFLAGWGVVVIVYLKTVLFVTGCFDSMVGVAHLYGYQIRENFPGVLLASSPREWWRTWRATMTHWLIRYVYVPLGGNRHAQVRNIAAVFAVSMLWHWVGVPFGGGTHFYPAYVPVLTWAVLNTLVMSVSAIVTQRWPAASDAPISVREFKMLLTTVFGCATVMLLAYTPQTAPRFAENMRVLTSFLGW
jgi:D-alanyl-lipoteichoic acid acyltransferase DltB (MBOAT superfamily)